MKLAKALTKRNESKNGKRRYTLRDMAVIKHDEAVLNSQVNRGDTVRHGTGGISVCGCGVEGCFIHHSRDVAK